MLPEEWPIAANAGDPNAPARQGGRDRLATAAMTLILARGRRRDRFGQCLVHFDDLSAEEGAILVQCVCAGLRGELIRMYGAAEADRMLAASATQVLASHDPGSGIDAVT